jgi:hypothetical protein
MVDLWRIVAMLLNEALVIGQLIAQELLNSSSGVVEPRRSRSRPPLGGNAPDR